MTLINSLKVYGVDDLVEFPELLKSDEFYPFDKEGRICEEIAVSFFIKSGYLYNPVDEKWYLLFRDGLYRQIRDEKPYTDIMIYLDHHAHKNSNNISLNSQKAIYERLRAVSMPHLIRKRDFFISNHDEYCLSWEHPDFIPVQNGLIHPETMELLPHCGYFVHPNVLGFNYTKMTFDEIISHPTYEDYLKILPDKETLELFLWWVGMVLFSPDLPRVILFLYGQGGTGKTTLSLGLSKILTPDAIVEVNTQSVKDGNRFFTSSIVGKKLLIMDEMTSSGKPLDDSLFKKLTGGNPVFTIEQKYKNPRNEVLTAKTMMMGNTYPSFIQDSAIIDRMFIIPCFKKQDKDIRELITDDVALNWLFNAAYYFYAEKQPHKQVRYLSDLRTPIMLSELERYRESDGLTFWLKDFLSTDVLPVDIVQHGLKGMSSTLVYNSYREFTSMTGGGVLSQRAFNQKLRLEYRLISKVVRKPDSSLQRCFVIDDGGIIDDGAN